MTIQQKLQIVSEQIREDIPRLMELREGCLVIHRNTLIKILYEDGNHYKAVTVEWNEPKPWILDKDVEYKIIGHEIMLNDVLGWLSGIDYYETELNYDELIIKDLVSSNNPSSCDPSSGCKKCYTWDLTKPLLKDQSEKLINFLYELQK